MKRINLKFEYPELYAHDYFYDVEDSVADVLAESRRLRHAQVQQRSYNRANYFYEDGLTEELMTLEQSSPVNRMIQREMDEVLYQGLFSLSAKSRKRLMLHFFCGMTQQEIARLEGVNQSNVARSIATAVRQLQKIFSDFFD